MKNLHNRSTCLQNNFTVFKPLSNKIDQFLAIPLEIRQSLKAITPKGIIQKMKLLNIKNAHGIDLITAKMLRELPKKCSVINQYF